MGFHPNPRPHSAHWNLDFSALPPQHSAAAAGLTSPSSLYGCFQADTLNAYWPYTTQSQWSEVSEGSETVNAVGLRSTPVWEVRG